MKKILISIFTFLSIFVCSSLCFMNVRAIDENSNSNDSQYVINRSELEVNYFLGGGTVYKQAADTYYAGYLDSSSKYYGLKPQTYQWVDLPSSSEDVKIVTWSKGTADGFKATTTTATAKDYEATHPGWIVVAAANGEWFHINDTGEATNLMVQDGEVVRPYVIGGPDRDVIGWKANGELIVGTPTLDNTMSLHIYNSKESYAANHYEELADLNIAAYNTTPSETGITLYTKDALDTYDLTGYTVYVGRYDLCRSVNYNRKPFVKGTIEKVVNDLTTNSKPLAERDGVVVREFYLVSKDGSLDDKLSVNNYVKCQFDLNGEWATVDSACGYVNQVLSNYEPMWKESCDTFGQYDEKTAVKPRMVIGFKEDGSVVMMDIDGRDEVHGHTGLSCFEAGELMRLAGCKTAYNLDGGGSATLAVRNEYNELEIVNIPSDGSERSIGNVILFVMRDPGISWDVKNTTRTTARFVLNETNISSQLTDVKVTIDGKSADMVDGVATVEGLKEDTEYVATIQYKVPSETDSGVIQNGSYKVKIKTKPFNMPSSGLVFEDANKTSIKLVKRETAYASWFQDVKVTIGGTEYVMGSNSELLITDLIEDTEYEAVITYNCVEPDTGNVYQGTETKKIKTLSYELPQITKFEVARSYDTKVILSYAYSDPDNVVVRAYIKINNSQEEELTTFQGTKQITNIDLAHNEYKFVLVLQYENGTAYNSEIKSDTLTAGNEVTPEVKHTITYDLDGGKNSSSNPTEFTEGEEVVLSPATKEGYTFKGWELNGEIVTKISSEVKEDVSLKAIFEKNIVKHTITYNLNGGVNSSSNPTEFTEGEEVVLNSATKEGYTFKGWEYNSEIVTKISSEVKEDVVLNAVFEKVEEPAKKGCGCKKSAELVITLTSALSLLVLVIRKKH